MKKGIIALLLTVLSGSIGSAAEKPLGATHIASVDELAAAIVSYFPKVQGEVRTVEGDLLTIGLGAKDGLVPGVTLTLWRDGREILHPVTGAVIGRVEDEVGSAEVVGLSETACTAMVRKRVRDPKPGDKARITPKKIALAVLPVRPDRPELILGLSERLSESGRFQVLESDKVAAFLKDKKNLDASLVGEISREYVLDVVAATGFYPSEDGRLMATVRLFYADGARPLDTIVAMLDLGSKKDAIGEVKPFFVPVKEGKYSIPDLPFDARLFAIADLEGSGTLQYVFSDGEMLRVYRLDASGWREVWAEQGSPRAGGIRHINLDVADINGNGQAEIFVTAMRNEKVVSRVMEFRDGLYEQIAEVPGFLRVAVYPGRGSVLIGQGYDPKSFYSGRPGQYVWSEGKYVPGPGISIPAGVGLYGFAFASVAEAAPLLVALDERDRLLVYSRGALLWRSEEPFPSVRTKVARPVTGIDAVLSREAAETDKSLIVPIPGRVIAMDLDGDGRDEILLPKNGGGTYSSGHAQAELASLGWTGDRLEQRWTIKNIPGAVLDFRILGQEGASRVLVLVTSPGGLFSGDTIGVMDYPAQ